MPEIFESATPVEATPSTPPAAAIPAAPAPQSAIPAVTPAAAPPAAPEGYVPSYRLRETREAAVRESQQQWAQREATLNAKYAEMERKFQALAGITPPANPEVTAVRGQFGQLYPGLTSMEERAQDILGILDRAQDIESQNDHYWQSYGRQTMDRLFSQAQESLGAPLTDEGKRQLHAAFTGFVQSSPELTARYTNDPTLVQDFWKQFTSSFIDPVRRVAAAGVAGSVAPRALPQDTFGGAPRATPAPQFGSLDDRASAAWTMYQQSRK